MTSVEHWLTEADDQRPVGVQLGVGGPELHHDPAHGHLALALPGTRQYWHLPREHAPVWPPRTGHGGPGYH